MHTVCIRLEDNVYETIEQKRGNVNKSDYYRNIISYWLSNKENTSDNELITLYKDEIKHMRDEIDHLSNKENTNDNEMITTLKDEIKHLRDENLKMLTLVNQSQLLQLNQQRLLQEPVTEAKKEKKPWYQFWKK